MHNHIHTVHSFISICRGLSLLHCLLRSERKTFLGCRAGISTRAWHTAGQRTTNWATLHPAELRCTLLSRAAPYWAMLHPNEPRSTLLIHSAPCWSKLRPWATLHSTETRCILLSHAAPWLSFLAHLGQLWNCECAKLTVSVNLLFRNSLPGWWGLAGDPADGKCVIVHAQNELFPWNQLFGNCYLAGEAWLAHHWMTVCHCAGAKLTIPVNQMFGICYLASAAGLTTPLNDRVSLRMRKMNYSRESAVWKLLPGWWGWAGVPPLNDNRSLRMRKMNYSRESAVWKLLPG